MTQAYNLSQLANKVNSSGQVDVSTGLTGTIPIANGGTGTSSTTYCNLASNVTGTLSAANGGTGAATLTANNVILGNGTSAVQVVAPGASGNILTSNGTTWTSASATLTSTQVANAYAGIAAGAVGSMVFALWGGGGAILGFGATTAGSNLIPSSASGLTNATPLSGTWRCLGYADHNEGGTDSVTLFIRTV
jgi:hypothetical protein